MSYTDSLMSRVAKAKDDGVEYEYQEVGKQMQDYYPVKQRGWLWSLFWKYPLADIKLAHEKTVAQDKKDVRYLNAILRAPFKD